MRIETSRRLVERKEASRSWPDEELPDDIDPGIRRMVEILNSKGLITDISCEGHRGHPGLYGSLPYVTIQPKAFQRYLKSKSTRMKAFLRACDAQASVVVRYYYDPGLDRMIRQASLVFGWSLRTNHIKQGMRRWENAAKRWL